MTYANIPRAPHLCLSNLGADWQKTRIIRTHVILHLIAVHHGWARPHFLPSAWDLESHTEAQNQQAALEAMRRFGRLQQRFGRWGLAWLESLMRCVDILASRQIRPTED